MKKLYWFEFSLLVTIDLIYLFCLLTQSLGNFGIRELGIFLTLGNLLLGPFQLIPALYLFFKNRHRNMVLYNIYLALAFLTIIVFTININLNLDHEIFITYFVYIQIFAWLLAHYFVFVLYDLRRLN